MKVTKETPESSFKPIKISIVIETKEEFDNLYNFTEHTITASRSIVDEKTNPDYKPEIVEMFLYDVHDALKD